MIKHSEVGKEAWIGSFLIVTICISFGVWMQSFAAGVFITAAIFLALKIGIWVTDEK